MPDAPPLARAPFPTAGRRSSGLGPSAALSPEGRPPSARLARQRCLLAAAGWMQDPGRRRGRAGVSRPEAPPKPRPGPERRPSLPVPPEAARALGASAAGPPSPCSAVGLTFLPAGLAPFCSPRLPARPLGERERRRHRGGREADREAQPSCPRPAGWQAGSGLTLVDARAAGRPQPGTSPPLARRPGSAAKAGRQAGWLSPPASPAAPARLLRRVVSRKFGAGARCSRPGKAAQGRAGRRGTPGCCSPRGGRGSAERSLVFRSASGPRASKGTSAEGDSGRRELSKVWQPNGLKSEEEKSRGSVASKGRANQSPAAAKRPVRAEGTRGLGCKRNADLGLPLAGGFQMGLADLVTFGRLSSSRLFWSCGAGLSVSEVGNPISEMN